MPGSPRSPRRLWRSAWRGALLAVVTLALVSLFTRYYFGYGGGSWLVYVNIGGGVISIESDFRSSWNGSGRGWAFDRAAYDCTIHAQRTDRVGPWTTQFFIPIWFIGLIIAIGYLIHWVAIGIAYIVVYVC